MAKRLPRKLKKIRKRNLAAKQAQSQPRGAGPMKDKRRASRQERKIALEKEIEG